MMLLEAALNLGFFHYSAINSEATASDTIVCMWNGCKLENIASSNDVIERHQCLYKFCPLSQLASFPQQSRHLPQITAQAAQVRADTTAQFRSHSLNINYQSNPSQYSHLPQNNVTNTSYTQNYDQY